MAEQWPVAPWTFGDDLASLRRIMAMAAPENKLRIYKMMCREYVRWITVGKLAEEQVLQPLREIGRAHGINDQGIEDVLVASLESPWEPPPPYIRESEEKLGRIPSKYVVKAGKIVRENTKHATLTPDEIVNLQYAIAAALRDTAFRSVTDKRVATEVAQHEAADG